MIRLMTFNLKYASETGANAWPDRRALVQRVITHAEPDVIGTQEGLYRQLREIGADLPEYDWIGTGRDGGSRGEFMAIFYRRDRFEPLEFDHFWLSDTPDTAGSSTWGNTNRRMVTWVRLREREGGAEFLHANTHFDFAADWQVQAADLLVRRLENVATPLALTGDFNAAAGASRAYARLVCPGGFVDTWEAACERRGEGIASFHDWEGPRPGPRIDWILVRNTVRCHSAELVTVGKGDGQWPSDHFPVLAEISLG